MVKSRPTTPGPTLDLHGRTTDEVPDLVDRFLRQATERGVHQVRIMTGKGTGKVQSVVKDYLRLGGYHWHFEKTPTGTQNPGVLIVKMD